MVGIGATAGSADGGWADPADVLGLATAEQPLRFGIGLRLTTRPPRARGAPPARPRGEVRAFDWRTQRTD